MFLKFNDYCHSKQIKYHMFSYISHDFLLSKSRCTLDTHDEYSILWHIYAYLKFETIFPILGVFALLCSNDVIYKMFLISGKITPCFALMVLLAGQNLNSPYKHNFTIKFQSDMHYKLKSIKIHVICEKILCRLK